MLLPNDPTQFVKCHHACLLACHVVLFFAIPQVRARMRMTEATDEINVFFHPFVADRSSWSNVSHHCSLLETKDACERAGCAVTHDEDYCVPPMAIPPAVFFGHFVNMYGPAGSSAFSATMLVRAMG